MAPSAQLDNMSGQTSAAMDLLDMFDAPMEDSWTQLDGQKHDSKHAPQSYSSGNKVLTPSASLSSISSSSSSSSPSPAALHQTSGHPRITSQGATSSQSSSSITPRVSQTPADHGHRHNHKHQEKNIHPFILLLVDGNAFQFPVDQFERGHDGGVSAADNTVEAVRDQVYGYDESSCKFVFRIYADFRKLAKSLTPEEEHSKSCLEAITSFASGMNSHEGFEFVDAGSEPDATLKKIQENFCLFSSHPSCQHVILGAHQSEWTSLLSSHEPCSANSLLLVCNDRMVRPSSDCKGAAHLDLTGVFQFHSQSSSSAASSSDEPTTTPAAASSARTGGSSDGTDTTTPAVTNIAQSEHKAKTVLVNDKNQRVDPQLPTYTLDEWQVYHNIQRTKQPCRSYHFGTCKRQDCQYDHGRLSEAMLLVLLHVTRATPCDFGPSCRDATCYYGHHCSRVGCDGRKCSFPSAAHGDAFDPARAVTTPASTITRAEIFTTSGASRPAVTATALTNCSTSATVPSDDRVLLNSKNQRIDPIIPRPSKLDLVRFMRLQKISKPPCQSFFLSQCVSADCGLDHTPLDASMTNIFAIGARQIPCEKGPDCRDAECTLGHHCQMRYCDNKDCKFPAALHNLDMVAALPPVLAPPPPALTAASVLGPSRPRKVVKTTWSSKPKDTIEYVSSANAIRRPDSQHSSPGRRHNRAGNRQTTPSQRSSSRDESMKSINGWKAFAEASHVEHTRPNYTPTASTTTGPATVAPAGFDLIDFDFEDRVGIGEVQEQAMDPAAVFRRTVLARSETSSPAQAQAQAQNEQHSVPELGDNAEVSSSDEVDAAEVFAESSDDIPAKASANTLFRDIAELMAGDFFGTISRKSSSTPTSATKKLATAGRARELSVSNDVVRPWLDTFDIVDDVDEYAQRMMEQSYEHREVESDVESDVESEL